MELVESKANLFTTKKENVYSLTNVDCGKDEKMETDIITQHDDESVWINNNKVMEDRSEPNFD